MVGTDYTVVLEWRDGRRRAVPVEEGESILEAAEAVDAGLPFGCRTGACATCTARLREGTVEHVRQPRALEDRHLADGYVLTCVSTPVADCRIAVGADVASELVSNPWK